MASDRLCGEIMTFSRRLTLWWRRFSPLEERLLAAVREVLPSQAQGIFDAQTRM